MWPLIIAFLLLGLTSCKKDELIPPPTIERVSQTITVYLKDTDTYQYATVGGDEESAIITFQAQHYSVSEIRRNAATKWFALYFYQPMTGYVGTDHAEIEIQAGSNGASPPTNIKTVAFDFIISN
jgi:hypothetical protein